jgi:hypothetical protein
LHGGEIHRVSFAINESQVKVIETEVVLNSFETSFPIQKSAV